MVEVSSKFEEAVVLAGLRDDLMQISEGVRKLASHPYRGFVWMDVRKRLRRVAENAIVLGYLRNGDARWLFIAQNVGNIETRCRYHVKGSPSKDARAVAHPVFQALGKLVDLILCQVNQLATAATGRTGPILPRMLPAPSGAEVKRSVLVSKGGIYLPAGCDGTSTHGNA